MYNILEHSSSYSDTTDSLWFYSKDEAPNLNKDIANTNNVLSFEYKAKFLRNTKADGANGISRYTIIALTLKVSKEFLEITSNVIG